MTLSRCYDNFFSDDWRFVSTLVYLVYHDYVMVDLGKRNYGGAYNNDAVYWLLYV